MDPLADDNFTLGIEEAPPEFDWDWPDPDYGRPSDLAGLTYDEIDTLPATAPAHYREPAWPIDPPSPSATGQPADLAAAVAWPAEMDCWLRDGTGGGAGFADGGVLDTAPAGLALAGFTTGAQAQLGTLTDDELTGVIRAWRRLSSRASAGELQAIAALARRRPADGTPPAVPGEAFPRHVSEFVGEEVAAALTLTPISGGHLTDLAMDLAGRLAPVRDVLAAGWIDLSRARLFAQATEGLADAHAAAVVAAVLPQAPELTSGRLRRALDRAVLAADPGSAQKQRDAALAQARVDCWPDPCGTANLAGRNLPAASVLAADKRLDAIARSWQAAGATGGIDQLRARAYLAQLLDQDTTRPPADLLAPPILTTQPDPHGRHSCPPPTPSQPSCSPRHTGSHQPPAASASGGLGGRPTQQHPPSSPVPPEQTGSGQPPPTAASDGPGKPPTRQHPPGSPVPSRRTGSGQWPAASASAGSGGSPAQQDPPGSPVPSGRTGSDQWPAASASAGSGGSPAQQHPPGSPVSPGDSGSQPLGQLVPAGLRPPPPLQLPPLAGSVNLTIPLLTLLGLAERPGEASGYGPLDPDTARALACAAAGHRATRWHVTLTGPTGRALGYGSTPASHAHTMGDGWQISVTAEPIAAGSCDHRTAEPQYRPSAGLQRVIRARTTTCSYYGCARPAARCDLDHSIAYDDGGLTCECDLAPLCRRHHRMKQNQRWTLEQVSPGVMSWLTPAGRRYITLPSQHPT